MAISESTGKTVLVTGINGYIASVLGLQLLAKGYTVRGTTRKVANVEPLLKGAYAEYRERVKIYIVPDMAISGAFDDAANGVDGIFHTTSPINFTTLRTYEDFVLPAVAGNETLLAAALRAGPQLRSVVFTSSMAAVINPRKDPEYTFTERDFASKALEEAEKNRDSAVGTFYVASKTAADRAFWKFREAQKPPFAMSTVNPSVVIGPPVALVSNPSDLNLTLKPIYNIFSGTAQTIPPNIGPGFFVDVRDVARIHIWVFENSSEADGERYIASANFGPNQAAADILRHTYKGTPISEKITLGSPGEGYLGFNKETGEVASVAFPPGVQRIDGSKAERAAGLKCIPFTQSVRETAKAMEPLL